MNGLSLNETDVAADRDLMPLRNPPLAALLGWVFPGLGHLYQGRIGKGILFFACVMGLLFTGLEQGGWRVVYFRWNSEEWRWPFLAQAGVGLVAIPALFLGEELAPSAEEVDTLHRRYGKLMDIALTYTMVAGLLNIMAVYDALAGPALYEEERRRLADDAKSSDEAPVT